jgi:hypothetical protein
VEVVLVHPVFVPFAFNFLRAVFAADFHSRKKMKRKSSHFSGKSVNYSCFFGFVRFVLTKWLFLQEKNGV